MEKISIEQVRSWCERNGYNLTEQKKRPDYDIEEVIKIAEEATNIESGTINRKTRRAEFSFARMLVFSFMNKKTQTNIVSERLNQNHCINSYAQKQQLFTTDLKYFKPWQREAISQFKTNIKELGYKI